MSAIAALLRALDEERALRDSLRHHQVLPDKPADPGPVLPTEYEAVSSVLPGRGLVGLYSHQERALRSIARGENVVLATPTASGKTLVYNLAALRNCVSDPAARALYLFPLKALEQDQRKQLERDIENLRTVGPAPTVAVYDGDTPPAVRRKLRSRPPSVLITTPDMLHAGILPNHGTWGTFLAGLRLVVVDELHAYRGIFGSQVAQVLRRLLRIAAFHGGEPQVVAASATIANPGELAEALTGRAFQVVQQDGAPRPRRHVLLFQPDASPYTLAARLFRLAVGQRLRTIAFTNARKITELMHTWIVQAEPGLRGRISSYRAGFLPEERRDIERRLFSGDLLGVISTSALEMGIDVGSLDVCVLVGYPGSQIATWQRAGRVGRSREAAIALVAQPDALDQYLVTHPRAFFGSGFEHAALDPAHPEVVGAHLPCAAAELPLRGHEPWVRETGTRERIQGLEEQGELLRSETGEQWFAARRRPHRAVDLRSAGESLTIVQDSSPDERPTLVGTIGAGRVRVECHEGAIYLHRGRQYLVTRLDLEQGQVGVRAIDAAHYTRALSEKQTQILQRQRSRPVGSFQLMQGRVRVTTRIPAYERRRIHGQELLGTQKLDLPPTSFETTSLWLEIPDEVPRAVEAAGGHPMGGLHAVEHAALSLFPLFVLCDRHDVAGISSVRHPQTGRATIFLYDAHPGGVGLVASLFERLEVLLEATLELVDHCPCEEGCPGCIHSPRCGSGNRPLDKGAALRVLSLLLAHESLPPAETGDFPDRSEPEPTPKAFSEPPAPPHMLFFDLETQRSADEVGGWHNAHLMRLALAVTYDTHRECFETFTERDVPDLLARLRDAELVVGFNVRRFDYQVLRGYTDEDLGRITTFDLLDAIHARLGFRLSLGHLSQETLGAEKSADGLTALRWWKEGRRDLIEHYCRQDVRLLHDLFRYAVDQGFLLFRTRGGERVRIPTRWSLAELLEQARQRRSDPPAAPRPGAGGGVPTGGLAVPLYARRSPEP